MPLLVQLVRVFGQALFKMDEFKIEETTKRVNQQGLSGSNCGPIIVENMEKYADPNVSNEAFVSDTPPYSLLHPYTDDYKAKIYKLRREHREICRAIGATPTAAPQVLKLA